MTTQIYNKLVRDKIPAIIAADDHIALTRILSDEEYRKALREKLLEEVGEYLAAEDKESRRMERADIAEVLLWLDKLEDLEPEELEQIRAEKAEERGGFAERIFLVETRPKTPGVEL